MRPYQTIPRFSIDFRVSDFLAGIACLFPGSKLPSPERLSLVSGRPAFWAGSGRQALWLILKALNLKKGSGVAIPLYGDGSLAEAIQRAGYTPVFVDVTEATMTMDVRDLKRVRDRISAVVAVHLFGHMVDISKLAAKVGDIPIIEDAAHAPFSYFNGAMAGTSGVACFYSFASSKPWPAGGGGLVIANEERLASRIREEADKLAPVAALRRSCNLIAQASKASLFRRSTYGLFGRPIRYWAEARQPLEPVLNADKIHPHQAVIALRQAQRLADRLNTQRRHSLRMLEALAKIQNITLPTEPQGAHYNYHLFPVLLQNAAERDSVAKEMQSLNVDVSQMYWDIAGRVRKFGYLGDCPVSESVASRMMTLPNHAELSTRDTDFVISSFLKAVNNYRSQSRLFQFAGIGETDATSTRGLGCASGSRTQ